jgi:hypothetical protein
MAIQIKDLLGWKKSKGQDVSKLGITGYTRIFGKQGSVSLLSSYDVADGAENRGSATYTPIAEILLLRRAQMLQ